MSLIQDSIVAQNNSANYYDYSVDNVTEKNESNDNNEIANKSVDNVSIANEQDEKYQTATYNKRTLLGMNKQDIFDKMLQGLSDVEELSKIRKLENEINPGEIYSFSIYDGKVHVGGGNEFRDKAAAYEKLVNASLHSSWKDLFGTKIVYEKDLMNKVEQVLRFYQDADYSYVKKDKKDSIVNHVEEAFMEWQKTIKPETKRFCLNA